MTIQTNLIDHPYQIVRVATGEIVGHYRSKREADGTLEQLDDDGLVVIHYQTIKRPPTDRELSGMTTMDRGDSHVLVLPDGTQRSTGYVGAGAYRDPEGYRKALRRLYTEWAS